MLDGKGALASGSSFFWSSNAKTFLVTNWHNFSGRNPLTNALMSQTGRVPNRISFGVFQQASIPDSSGFYELNFVMVNVSLDSETSEALWFEHPTFGQKVDIAAIDVTEFVQGFQIAHANELESDAILDVVASQEVFVVGFPFGLIANAPAPIWKRGSLALDPSFDTDGLPKMLIDTATREGMSGSVVLARHVVVGRDYLKKDGTRSPTVLFARHDTVLGIYSGRHYPHFEKAQLGIVWKRRVIDETILGGRRGNTI